MDDHRAWDTQPVVLMFVSGRWMVTLKEKQPGFVNKQTRLLLTRGAVKSLNSPAGLQEVLGRAPVAVRPVELERVQRTLRGRVDVTLSEDLGPPMTVPHSVLLGVVLRGLQNWRLSLVGTPMLMPPLQWQERGGPEVHVICLLGCGQESAGLDLLPQEHRWKWLVVLLPREREIELRGCLDLQLSVRKWQDWCILASPGIQLPEELGEQE